MGKTIYISKNGSDTKGDGSILTPYKTRLRAAIEIDCAYIEGVQIIVDGEYEKMSKRDSDKMGFGHINAHESRVVEHRKRDELTGNTVATLELIADLQKALSLLADQLGVESNDQIGTN